MKQTKSSSRVLIIAIIAIILCTILALALCDNVNTLAYADNEAYTDTPVITVILHGLGGSPTDWSNDGIFPEQYEEVPTSNPYYYTSIYRNAHFIYRKASIIERLRLSSNGNVYVISEKNNDFSNPYIDRFDIEPNSPTGYTAQNISLSDINYLQHVILVYNSIGDFGLSTDEVYAHFKSTINAVVSSYADSHRGIVPKMNLIGHSRGTIINLKYATEYPDRIDSMFGLGGLYNGAELASVALSLGLQNNSDFVLSGMFNSAFVQDIKRLASPVCVVCPSVRKMPVR